MGEGHQQPLFCVHQPGVHAQPVIADPHGLVFKSHLVDLEAGYAAVFEGKAPAEGAAADHSHHLVDVGAVFCGVDMHAAVFPQHGAAGALVQRHQVIDLGVGADTRLFGRHAAPFHRGLAPCEPGLLQQLPLTQVEGRNQGAVLSFGQSAAVGSLEQWPGCVGDVDGDHVDPYGVEHSVDGLDPGDSGAAIAELHRDKVTGEGVERHGRGDGARQQRDMGEIHNRLLVKVREAV
ncbi:hypothetical protein D3C87_1454910 [compost metagenome]